MPATPTDGADRILILVVDRDDDLGVKAHVKSPVIGREANLEAAMKLALADPEDSDANTIFSAVKLYDEMKNTHKSGVIEIATVTGDPREGVEADLKISNELREILQRFPANKCVFVSDGATDALVTPIVGSQVSIVSVKRVIVRQSQSIEQAWLLLSRYLRLATTDPRYTKIFLGVPGIFIAAIGLLYALGLANLPAILLTVGIILISRGFGLDQVILRSVKNFSKLSQMASIAQMRLYASLAALAVFLIAIYTGTAAALERLQALNPTEAQLRDAAYILSVFPKLLGAFIVVSIDFITVSVLLVVISNLLYYLFIRHPRFWRTIQAGVASIWLWALLKRAGILLEMETIPSPTDPVVILFLLTGVFGVFTLAITFALTRTLQRIYSKQFRRPRLVK
ncbi:MAG: DUF373 family protein [Aigarchaeota archaeon]|nr:DUF373 family protein [Candidatus Pelearchaeum maunauluense]